MKFSIPEAKAPMEICWDNIGIPHIFAKSIEDAYRGMGYACASERLWQLHLSNLYATGTAASVMGEKYVAQDLMHKAFNVVAGELLIHPVITSLTHISRALTPMSTHSTTSPLNSGRQAQNLDITPDKTSLPAIVLQDGFNTNLGLKKSTSQG